MKNRFSIVSLSPVFRTNSVFAGAIAVLLAGQSSRAANLTWDGGGDANWLTSLNWAGDVAPVANDVLIFDGVTGLTNNNDFTANTQFNGITFNSTAGDFTLGGNAINLGGNLVDHKTSGTQTISLDLALTGNRTATVASGGTLALGGAVSGAFNLAKNGAGKILLTSASNGYSGSTIINGGTLSLETTGVMSAGALTLGNGELAMTGTAAAPRTQSVGALTLSSGRNTITLAADAAQPISLTAASFAARAAGATTLFRGTGLGSAPGVGVASIFFTTAPTPVTAITTGANNAFAATGTGTLGTTQAAVLRGGFADTSATGGGSGFATYDATNGVRALSASEQATTYSSAVAGDNVLINMTGATAITGKQTNTLQVSNTTGGALSVTNSGTALMPANGLLFTGTSATTLTGGSLTFALGASVPASDMVIHSSNTATVTISTTLASSGGTGAGGRSYVFGGPGNFIVTSANVGSSGGGGNYFNGPGTVELRGNAYGPSSAGTVVNGGTLKLGGSFALSGSITRPMSVASGATFDINNISVASTGTSGLDAINNINSAGGTVTNSGGTVTNLKLSLNNGAGDFAGTVSGNINLMLVKQGATTNRIQKFTNALTYVGFTGVTSGNATGEVTSFLTLGAGGSLPSATDVTLGGVINGNGNAAGNGVLTLGDGNGAASQTIASLASGGTGTANAVVGGSSAISTLTINGSTSTTFGGVIGGVAANNNNLALVRSGAGSLTLTGNSTYTGATTVSGGTLYVNGSLGNTAVGVEANGTLAGTGTIGGTVAVAGTLSPGTSPGTLSTGAQTWSNGGDYNWQMVNATGAAGTGFDTTAIAGTLDLSTLTTGGFNLNLWSLASTGPDVNGDATNFDNTLSQSWTLASTTGGIVGFEAEDFVINTAANNGTAGFSNALGAGTFSVSQSGNNLQLNFTVVPEPGTAILGGLGLLAMFRRRRN